MTIVFTLHQKSNRIRTGLKPDRGNAHSMCIDRVHTAFLAQPYVYSPPTNDCRARTSCSPPWIIEMRLYHLWFHVELLYCCGLFYDYVEHRARRVSKERRFLRRWSRFRVTPSSSLWTFNSLAPTRLQGPLSLRSSSQKIFSYAHAINGEC